jgi:hypothetical protein
MQSPSFVLRGAKSVRDGEAELVQIDFTNEVETCKESGYVYLDPEKSWAIRKVEVLSLSKPSGAPVQFESTVDYQKVGENAYFPKRLEFVGKTRKADRYEHAIVEMSKIEVGKVSPEIFTLMAYGLPDIPLTPVRTSSSFSFRNPLFWGALIAAVASFALLGVLRPHSRNASKGGPP